MSADASTACLRCSAAMAHSEQFCSACGADRTKELEIAALHGPALGRARKWILAVGIVYVASGLLVWTITRDSFDASGAQIFWGTTLALFAAHVGLWWWARSAPYPAALVALVLFLSVQGVNAVIDPTSLYKGFIIKGLFLVALVKAIQAGHQAQRLRGRRA